jgi:hypothetical protein
MPSSDLRLLALDGGVRGLSALMILEQLMEAVDPDAPPKSCDYFDMIGGTSTGGWVVPRSLRHEKVCLPGSWIQRSRQGVYDSRYLVGFQLTSIGFPSSVTHGWEYRMTLYFSILRGKYSRVR